MVFGKISSCIRAVQNLMSSPASPVPATAVSPKADEELALDISTMDISKEGAKGKPKLQVQETGPESPTPETEPEGREGSSPTLAELGYVEVDAPAAGTMNSETEMYEYDMNMSGATTLDSEYEEYEEDPTAVEDTSVRVRKREGRMRDVEEVSQDPLANDGDESEQTVLVSYEDGDIIEENVTLIEEEAALDPGSEEVRMDSDEAGLYYEANDEGSHIQLVEELVAGGEDEEIDDGMGGNINVASALGALSVVTEDSHKKEETLSKKRLMMDDSALLPDEKITGNNDIDVEDIENSNESFLEINTRRRMSQEGREGNCYCGKDRNLNIAELLCASCYRWYHESCIGYQLGKLVPFMMNYVFVCKNCSPNGLESFKRNQPQFTQMCITAVANLIQMDVKDGRNRKMFSLEGDIIPFFEMHWDGMTTMPRRTQSWHKPVSKALLKDQGKHFEVEGNPEDPNSPYFGLKSLDITQIRPHYEAMIRSGHLKLAESQNSIAASRGGRGSRRRVAGDVLGLSHASLAKRVKGEALPKVPSGHGYPSDHPFNKEGFRYELAEPDSFAPYRQEFDESIDFSRVIPGFLYRVHSPWNVFLAMHDRAPQLKVSEDRHCVTGEKGYCMIRATHGVSFGSWYWEAKIIEMPEGSHTRLGWGQPYANLQGPIGVDKFGYSYRSRHGTKFHEAKGKHYGQPYGLGDTIGFLIILPEPEAANRYSKSEILPPSHKEKPLVKFKSHLYYEDKIEGHDKELKSIHKGSKIVFYKNGVCQGVAFEEIYDGMYFPSISLYKNITVSVNFGPSFAHLPKEYPYRAMCERAEESIIQQTVADLVFLTENEGNLRLDNIY